MLEFVEYFQYYGTNVVPTTAAAIAAMPPMELWNLDLREAWCRGFSPHSRTIWFTRAILNLSKPPFPQRPFGAHLRRDGRDIGSLSDSQSRPGPGQLALTMSPPGFPLAILTKGYLNFTPPPPHPLPFHPSPLLPTLCDWQLVTGLELACHIWSDRPQVSTELGSENWEICAYKDPEHHWLSGTVSLTKYLKSREKFGLRNPNGNHFLFIAQDEVWIEIFHTTGQGFASFYT